MAAADSEAAERQKEEIEALSAIYGDEWCTVDEVENIFCIKISDCLEKPKWTVCLQVILPPEYPSSAPPIYQLNAPWLRGQDYTNLANNLEEMYLCFQGGIALCPIAKTASELFVEKQYINITNINKRPKHPEFNILCSSLEVLQNLGESILYLWVEKIREILIEKSLSSDPEPDSKKNTEETDVAYEEDLLFVYQPLQECTTATVNFDVTESQGDEESPPIYHGNPITDRRSTFQAHLAPVVSPKQVKNVLVALYENKKIASATHNIYAYRIYCEDKQTFLQDCEDDGETAAGGRLLHLMQILNVRNVLVVVSRWYGGILLGPDRFKHINNCARNILVEYNYTNSSENLSKLPGKNKRIRKDKKRIEH